MSLKYTGFSCMVFACLYLGVAPFINGHRIRVNKAFLALLIGLGITILGIVFDI